MDPPPVVCQPPPLIPIPRLQYLLLIRPNPHKPHSTIHPSPPHLKVLSLIHCYRAPTTQPVTTAATPVTGGTEPNPGAPEPLTTVNGVVKPATNTAHPGKQAHNGNASGTQPIVTDTDGKTVVPPSIDTAAATVQTTFIDAAGATVTAAAAAVAASQSANLQTKPGSPGSTSTGTGPPSLLVPFSTLPTPGLPVDLHFLSQATSSSTTDSASAASSHKNNTAAIAGSVVGGLVLIGAVAFLVWFRSRRQKQRSQQQPSWEPSPNQEMETASSFECGDSMLQADPFVVVHHPEERSYTDVHSEYSGNRSEWMESPAPQMANVPR